jgi:hypothetical protein
MITNHSKKTKHMKKLITISLLSLLTISCTYSDSKKRQFSISFSNDGGWTTTNVECDSFSMQDNHSIKMWVDGQEIIVFSEDILPKSLK